MKEYKPLYKQIKLEEYLLLARRIVYEVLTDKADVIVLKSYVPYCDDAEAVYYDNHIRSSYWQKVA